MSFIARALLIFTFVFAGSTIQAQPYVDPAFARTKVVYERTNSSEQFTTVYDRQGRAVGQFFNTPIEVPVDDRFIAASTSAGSKISQDILNQGMILVRSPNGQLMVRVLASSYSGYRANKSNFAIGFSSGMDGFGPSGDFYIPLSDLQQNKMKIMRLKEGANSKGLSVYSRFVSMISQPSGDYVQINNDIDNDHDMTAAPNVNSKGISIYPPTCDCAKGSCPITSDFGPRARPCKGCSTYHRGIDISGGIGTKLVAPDRVAVSENGWNSGGYGFRTVLRSLTYTNPQLYYAFNHMTAKPPLSVGQILQPGDLVGILGGTGRISGPHLHFEVYNGTPDLRAKNQIDPMPLVKMNMQGISMKNSAIVSYTCDQLRSREQNGPNQLRGSGRSGAIR